MKLDNIKKYMYLLICISLLVFIVKYSNFVSIISCFIKVLIPIVIGFLYAWFVNPLVCKFKFSRKISSLIVFLIVISIIAVFMIFIVPTLYKEIKSLVIMLPKFLDYINDLLDKFNLSEYISLYSFNIDNIPLIILKNIKGIIISISSIVIGLMIGLYMSLEYDNIYNFIMNCVRDKSLVNELSDKVRCCIKGTLFVAFIVFILDTVYFYIIKLDGALLLGSLCGLTDLIPYIGPYIGGTVAVLVSLGEGGKLWLLTLIGCVGVQILENNILQPCIISKTTKLSPLLVIIGMTVFGKLFGVIGMIIATPLVCMLSIIFKYYFYSKYFTNSKI